MNKVYTHSILAVLTVLCLLIAACGSDGTSIRPVQNTTNMSTTKGGELLDLKKAFDEGIISQSEYEKQRKIILNRK